MFDYNDLSDLLVQAGKRVLRISEVDEDDTDAQKELLAAAMETAAGLRPLADLYTAYLMDSGMLPDEYRELFECLATGRPLEAALNPDLPAIFKAVEDYRDRHDFFHWPLAFPDVFGPEGVGGFSATVGNPPWDVLQPNTQEFYIVYDPDFRQYKKQEALKAINRLHERYSFIDQAWRKYQDKFKQASSYCKEPCAYISLQKGKVDLYKAFLERFFVILTGLPVITAIFDVMKCTIIVKPVAPEAAAVQGQLPLSIFGRCAYASPAR